MSVVMPRHIYRMTLGERVLLTFEVLIAYIRVRLAMRDEDGRRAVARLRRNGGQDRRER